MADEPKRKRVRNRKVMSLLPLTGDKDDPGMQVHKDVMVRLKSLGIAMQGEGSIDLGNGMIGVTAAKLVSVMEALHGKLETEKSTDEAIALSRAIGYLGNAMTRVTAEFRKNNEMQKVTPKRKVNYTPGQVVNAATVKVEPIQ